MSDETCTVTSLQHVFPWQDTEHCLFISHFSLLCHQKFSPFSSFFSHAASSSASFLVSFNLQQLSTPQGNQNSYSFHAKFLSFCLFYFKDSVFVLFPLQHTVWQVHFEWKMLTWYHFLSGFCLQIIFPKIFVNAWPFFACKKWWNFSIWVLRWSSDFDDFV